MQWQKNFDEWHRKQNRFFIFLPWAAILLNILLLLLCGKSFCLDRSIDDAWVYEWYQATLILRTQTEMEWMGVVRERANSQKSCLSTCIHLEQQALNRQGFPDSLWFLYTQVTHAHPNIHMHAHSHPLRDRRGLVLSYLKILWVTPRPPSPLYILSSNSSVTERNDNAVTVFCLPRSRLYTFYIVQAVNDGWCDIRQL